MKFKVNNAQGVSALPTILLLSGIILEVVVGGLAVAHFFSRSLLSEQLSAKALKVAEAGAHDAISRINDYINCPDYTSTSANDAANSSKWCPSLYKFVVDSDLPDACVSIGAITGGKMTIYSRGSAFLRYKTIKVILGITTTEARVEVQSFKEVATPNGVFDSSCDQS